MPLDIYTPQDLVSVMFDERQTVATNQWLTMFFPGSHMSDQEEIMFDKIDGIRPIAPFMLPNLPGRPIDRRTGERVNSFKPAYTKPKDSIRPGQVLAMQPAEIARRVSLMTPQQRFDAEVVRITQLHRSGIERLWDYMGARALIDGQIVITPQTDLGVSAHSVTLTFGRDAGHTITLGAGFRWGDAGVKVFDNLQTWIDTVANAEFGGAVTDIMLGSLAAAAFIADADMKTRLDTTVRGSEEVSYKRGLILTDPLNPFTYLGTLGSGVRVWRVAGVGNTFQNADLSTTAILGPKQCLLVSPSVMGIKCFGAIQDIDFNLQPGAMFPKMWDENDPSKRFIMTQSSPLMVPQNPNCTLLANVLP